MRRSDLWLVLLFAVPAVGFLVVGAPLTKEAAAGAGFVLAGAAITRMVDAVQERRREEAAAQERRRTDLDETRRLAYMVLLAGDTKDYELVATVGNALAHHGLQTPFEEATNHLVKLVRGSRVSGNVQWLQAQIDEITAKLDAENERLLSR
jgi:outer membrane murein-binding lipoprotein Lpp